MGVYPSNRRLNRNRRLNPNSFFFFHFIFYYLSVLSSSPSSTKKLSLPTAVFLLKVKMKKFTLILMLAVTFSLTQICVGCAGTRSRCSNNKCIRNGRRQHQVAQMGDKSTPTTPPINLKKT